MFEDDIFVEEMVIRRRNLLNLLIGVAAVIALITTVSGFSTTLSSSFSNMGAGTLTVSITGSAAEGFTVTNSHVDEVGTLKPLVDVVRSGVCRGAVALVGCNNPRVRPDYAHIELMKKMIANDIIVIVSGCSAQAAAKAGLMYPPNPTSCQYSTIGGNVATNAGGASGAKYGVTRDYLLGLTAVMPDGTVLRLGNKCQKDVAGFDLPRLLCGSEGLLAFIADVTLKLIPLPQSIRTALAYFSSAEVAGAVVTDIVSRRILPCTLELMDHTFLKTVADVYGVPCPDNAGAALLIEVDGHDVILDSQMDIIQQVCQEHDAIGFQTAHSAEERETLWKARRGGTAALVRKADVLVTLDYAVPISQLPRALKLIENLAAKHHCNVVTIAHAADGNLHPMVLYSPSNQQQAAAYKAFCNDSVQAILDIGGTISGEHGIGLEKKAYLPLQAGHEQMRIMKGICRIFDPYGIMNPGKMEM